MAQTATSPQAAASRGMQTFFLVWFGQMISLVGTGLTNFGINVWVLQQTGSITQFALMAFFNALPAIVLAPISGALVDRMDRRWAMIASDTAAALGTFVLALLFFTNTLQIWHIYAVIIWAAIFRSVQEPAYAASVALMVPKEQLGRANGLIQVAFAIEQLLAPLIAGALIGFIQIQGLIAIDMATFLFALVTLLLVRIPRPKQSEAARTAQGSLLREVGYGWRYLQSRPGLLVLMLYFGIINFLAGMVIILVTPLILSFASPLALGAVQSAAGLGMLAGGIAMGVWGGPKRRAEAMLGFIALMGVCMIIAGLQPSVWLIGVAAFIFLFCLPVVGASTQTIWQRKIAPDVQGRVFALRQMVSTAAMPLAFLLAGPLTDGVFQPLITPGGALSSNVGAIIGTGPGRGIGLLFIVFGFLTLLVALVGYSYPRLRNVERELPDVLTDETASDGDLTVQPQPAS